MKNKENKEDKENKILEESIRRGPIMIDPCPMSMPFIGKLIELFLKKKS